MNSAVEKAKPVVILGISAYYHDSAACILRDGEVIGAAQEERFSRKKHDPRFPQKAVEYCLKEAGCAIEQVDYVAFYEKPFLKFDRLLHSYLAYAPKGLPSFLKAIPLWIKEKIWMKDEIRAELNFSGSILFPEHHESHAASAFFPSPFSEAAVLTVDGVGEWTTTGFGIGRGNRVETEAEISFPHSLGLLYSAFTYFTGFTVNSGEYKLMGLAPYGEPAYKDLILRELIDLKEDGSFKLNMKYFNYGVGLTMTNDAFARLFGGEPRQPDTRLTKRDMDMARSIQEVTEEILLRMARQLHLRTGQKNLCLAGGVALNCVANGRILREGPFENLWIQPAAGDAGGALGAALLAWHQYLGQPRQADGARDFQKASLLGPRFSREEIRRFLQSRNTCFTELSDEELPEKVADELAAEKVIGWFHGRMEFGPRALGARSIIGDPRSTRMQATMNLKIKFRESFRPFAPCVLREHVQDWFDMRPNEESPYMLLVAPVLKRHRVPMAKGEYDRMRAAEDLVRWVNLPRSTVPAITHVDYSARVQTVDERHGQFRRVMEEFHKKTGCPIVVNTSFNLSWEPIVCTPEQAYNTFMQSEMDVLVLENFLLKKEEQPVGFRVSAGPETLESPWADPRDGEPLVATRDGALNPKTGARYQVEEGIPKLLLTTGGKEILAAEEARGNEILFAERDDVDTVRALLETMRADLYARLLNEQIPYDARVLEIGCGAGHLTNFLAVAHRSALGVDSTPNSLKLAQAFAVKHTITQAAFAQMNPFEPALREGFFDYVICNTLDRASDARQAFGRVSRLAKSGRYVVVRFKSVEPLDWLAENEFECIQAIPKSALGSKDRLFEPRKSKAGLWGRMRANDFIVVARKR